MFVLRDSLGIVVRELARIAPEPRSEEISLLWCLFFSELCLRQLVLGIVVLAIAACGSSNTTPTGTKPPPPTASTFDTLSQGSVPASGGTITVNKSGDPLNGLTMTVPSGAFSGALTVTIGSSTNKNLPTANGIVPISPVVHVVTSAGGYAKGAITFKVPVTVATGTFPVVVLYDSVTKAIEPMTTIAYDGSSVTAITGHLSQASAASVSADQVRGRVHAMASGGSSDSLSVSFGVYAIPTAVLNQDWDTHYRPGTNDWEMPAFPTEAAPASTLLGVAATELWYFNAKPSTTPLHGRFAAVRNAPLSDTIGFHWTSLIDGQVSNQVNSYLSSAYKSVTQGVADRDSLQFNQIRASFALGTLNGGAPLPVLVDLQSSAINGFYFLIAYRATGKQIYVGDPISPGDSSRFLQLVGSGMTPYVNPLYKAGVSFTTPLATPLGLAIPLAPLASSYTDATAGTAGASLFPTSGFYTWSGPLFDTMYVVDTLRFWAQCATCQYGFTSTLSPSPSGNVESSYNIYRLSGGVVTDSNGGLGANGLLTTSTSFTPGTQATFGLPLSSADAAGTTSASGARRWLDWHQFTITNLQVTISPTALQAVKSSPQTLQVSVSPTLLPADVAYQWNFGDSTPNVTVQNSPSVQHAFAKTGTLPTTVKIIDNRNTQVIAQGNTTVTVTDQVEVWSITSLRYLYTLVNGVQGHAGDPGVPNDTLVIVVNLTPNPTLVALNGPPFPNANYPQAGFAFVRPSTGPLDWANFPPDPLAISTAAAPYDVIGYSNIGTDTSGTITGQVIVSKTDSGATNIGHTVSLAKKGATLSGYIRFQYTVPINGVPTTNVLVDSVIAQRVSP